MTEREPVPRRQWTEGPVGESAHPWLSLSDDELLYQVEALGEDHGRDHDLLQIVRSERHFFIRQEAAKKIRDHDLLKDHSGDRHIGQILVRGLTRNEDVEYLRRLMAETRHLEVRKAADVQLQIILRKLGAAPAAAVDPPARKP